jgi:hypothetical protein
MYAMLDRAMKKAGVKASRMTGMLGHDKTMSEQPFAADKVTVIFYSWYLSRF